MNYREVPYDSKEPLVAGSQWYNRETLQWCDFGGPFGKTFEAYGFGSSSKFRVPLSIATDTAAPPGEIFLCTGQRRQFETGAHRDANTSKGRMDLLPWDGLMRLSKHFQKGAATHGENNWKKGIPNSVLMDSCLRHLAKAQAGHTDEDHVTAALWNLSCLVDQLERIAASKLDAKLNDIPNLK